MFAPYIQRWGLRPDAGPILTASSRLLPVVYRDRPAMLKIAAVEEERRGNAVMSWWGGKGAAFVFEHDDRAILIERAGPEPSLEALARGGRDDDATRIACDVAAALHAHAFPPPVEAIPLAQWFSRLRPCTEAGHAIIRLAARTAAELLATPQAEAVVLHGDIHHGNILHFGTRGWLAIDPKGLVGERGFDYASLFCNPSHGIAIDPVRFARRLEIVAQASGIDRSRLLRWILAWTGLSALWMLDDGMVPKTPLRVARLAAAELGFLPKRQGLHAR